MLLSMVPKHASGLEKLRVRGNGVLLLQDPQACYVYCGSLKGVGVEAGEMAQ